MGGPLRVHPANPRYFADASGKAVFLTGSHTWGNLQDYTYDTRPSPAPMDFAAYLAFMKQHNHNFFRLWAWESAFNPNAKQGTIRYDPMPYQRPGPGTALDGKPKFDLVLQPGLLRPNAGPCRRRAGRRDLRVDHALERF